MKQYTMRCCLTGETSTVNVCDVHAQQMPLESDAVTVQDGDAEIACEFCVSRKSTDVQLLLQVPHRDLR